MGTKENPGPFDVYANLEPDEPMFVIMGRDRVGPDVVRAWAHQRRAALELSIDTTSGREALDEIEKINEAERVADAMEQWRHDNRG